MSKKNLSLSNNLYGSVYLIQENNPTKFVGSIVGETLPQKLGEVIIELFEDTSCLNVITEDNQITIQIREDIALEIAKHILHVVAENRALREIYNHQDLKENMKL
jgi:hypothetical protein